jgi:uncharacterized protein
MIKNSSNGRILAKNTKHCKSFFGKAKGLMFTLPKQGQGLVFHFSKEEIIPITMLFVFYPIDILWLNERKEIVEMKEKAHPFLFSISPKRKAKYVVELPSRRISESETKIGQKIIF